MNYRLIALGLMLLQASCIPKQTVMLKVHDYRWDDARDRAFGCAHPPEMKAPVKCKNGHIFPDSANLKKCGRYIQDFEYECINGKWSHMAIAFSGCVIYEADMQELKEHPDSAWGKRIAEMLRTCN